MRRAGFRFGTVESVDETVAEAVRRLAPECGMSEAQLLALLRKRGRGKLADDATWLKMTCPVVRTEATPDFPRGVPFMLANEAWCVPIING